MVGSTALIGHTIDAISDEASFAEAESIEVKLVGSTTFQAAASLKNNALVAEDALISPIVSSVAAALLYSDAISLLAFGSYTGDASVNNCPSNVAYLFAFH